MNYHSSDDGANPLSWSGDDLQTSVVAEKNGAGSVRRSGSALASSGPSLVSICFCLKSYDRDQSSDSHDQNNSDSAHGGRGDDRHHVSDGACSLNEHGPGSQGGRGGSH